MKSNNPAFADDRFPHMPDLSSESERRRLGPSAIRIVFAVVAAWNLSDQQVRGLLALGPDEVLDEVRADPDPGLFTEDRMYRLSYLIGIYEGLHIIWDDKLADRWVRLPNRNAIFGGLSPLDHMIHGGRHAMRQVRRLVDARCAGN